MTTAQAARRPREQILFGLLMFAGYLGSQFVSVLPLQYFLSAADLAALMQGYAFAVILAPSLVLMLAGFWAWRRWFSHKPVLVGDAGWRDVVRGIGLVLLIQALAAAISVFLDMPPEPFMTALYTGKTPAQIVVMVICVLIWAPLIEELTFRHFLIPRIDDQPRGWRMADGISDCVQRTLFRRAPHDAVPPPALLFSAFRLGTGAGLLPLAHRRPFAADAAARLRFEYRAFGGDVLERRTGK